MATRNQYKTTAGGAWAAIPAYAITGTLQGGPVVAWPQPTALTGDGRPCAAIGRPTIRIHSTLMTGQGVKWWHDLVGASAQSVEFWISAFDERANAYSQFKGWLSHPLAAGPVLAGSDPYYTDVTITITEATAV